MKSVFPIPESALSGQNGRGNFIIQAFSFYQPARSAAEGVIRFKLPLSVEVFANFLFQIGAGDVRAFS